MTLTIAIFTLILSLILLLVGAELALNASEKVGKLFQIPPLLTGMLIIGLGTSLPEFFVSHLAALNGQGQMALGNIVGSNISNLLLVLGVTLLLQKIIVAHKDTLRQIGLHLLLSMILSFILLFNKLHILSCLVLITFFLGHIYQLSKGMKKTPPHKKTERTSSLSKVKKALLFIKLSAGFGLLYYGGEILVKSGSTLCHFLGISEYIISVIFIALGTSLPELLTSLLAIFQKKDLDLIVGNIIGSNIFNVAFIMGSLAFYNLDLSRGFLVESLVLFISSSLLFIFSLKKWPLNRPLGLFFMALYSGILYYWTQA